MAKRKRKCDDDDGRVIVSMNVDGMPWYNPGRTETISERERREEADSQKPEYYAEDKLTKEERRAILFGAMRGGCLAGLIAAAIVTIGGVVAYLVLGGLAK